MTGPLARRGTTALCAGSGLAVLWWSGTVLPGPPVTSGGSAQGWYVDLGAATAVVAALRMLVVATATVALVATGWRRLPQLVRELVISAVARIAPRSLQRLAHGLAGLSLTAGLAPYAPSAGSPSDGEPGTVVLRADEDAPEGTASMRRVDPPAEVTAPPMTASAPPATSPVAPSTPTAAPAAAPPVEVVVVEHGDSFWSIAEDVLRDRGQAIDDASVTTFWRTLIEVNREHLIDPENADLIHPGLRLTIPPG